MIYIIADSTFGISKEYADKNRIKIVNLKLILDGNVSDEGFEENWSEFYSRFSTSKNFVTTSQPNATEYIQQINDIYAEDANAEIIILTISSSLSGTINSATIAAKEFEGKKVVAIDSEQASTCGRLMVEELVDHINAGRTYDEIVNKIIPILKKKLVIQFVPHTMDALKRGGRIGKLSATIASILKIKPVFNFKQGTISVAKKTIGLGRAIIEMVNALPKMLKKLYVVYIDDKSNIETIKARLDLSKIKYDDVLAVGPVFGAHVGIGSVGLASLEDYEV